MKNWVLVLNRAEARIFRYMSLQNPITLFKKFDNEIGRERNKSLTHDRPGTDRFRAGSATISHSMSGEKDPHEEATEQFVRAVGEFVELARKRSDFENLVVFADPHLTGMLKIELSDITQASVTEWNQKNLGKLSDSEIDRMIREPNAAELEFPERTPRAGTPRKNPHVEIPLKVMFRQMDSSDSIRGAVEERVSRLERFDCKVDKCEVVISAPHQHSQHHKIFHVEIRLHIPGDTIVIDREPEKDDSHSDIYVAIRDAFDSLERKVETKMAKRRINH